MGKKINLNEFAGGALNEKVSQAFGQVMKNMQDPNTSYKDKRRITVELVFDQTEERDSCDCTVSVKSKLAPVLPTKTQFFTGKDLDTGEVDFEEYGSKNTMKGQMEIRSNGEVEEAGSSVKDVKDIRDFRKAAN